ncbi:toxin MazF [Candidatus Gracilibacteria bacterium]|nr:MAG: toxin MazF [Candidatus Gracilibacteria bacterium]
MVEQGDIIKVNFNPQLGHEEAGYRPAVVISNNFFNKQTNYFPLHIPLDNRTKITGSILCQHVRTLDLDARNYYFVEKLPKDLAERN